MTYSIIQKSQLEGANRLDAEFYCVLSQIKSDFVLGAKAIKFIQYGTSKELNEEQKGFPVLRLNEFEDFFIKTPEKYCNKISTDIFNSLRLKKGDVLICRTNGNPKFVGKSAVALEDMEIAFASYLFRVRPKEEFISPEVLTTFLNSKIGRNQIERFLMPSIQSNFSPAQFRAIKIPILQKEIQKEIDSLVGRSFSLSSLSLTFYSQAEDLLLEELGLSSFAKAMEDERDLSWIVNLSDVKSASRIDAEYFQPKYQKLVEQIKKHNAKLLGELVLMKKGFEPGSDVYQEEGKLFIRVSSVSKLGIEEKDQKYLSEELHRELQKDYEPKLGDILLTKDATPGIAYVIKEPLEGIIAGGVLNLKIKNNVESEYLALCINSIIGKWQAERDAGGSVIAHWKPEQIKNILIPVLPKPAQQKIAELVKKAHEARKKSKELLEEAKGRVEGIIENPKITN